MTKNTNTAKAIKPTATATAAKTPAPTEKIEIFGVALTKFVKEHLDTCVEHAEGSDSYFLRKVDLGKGPSDFEMVITAKEAKEGKRASCKRELYRVNADGSRGRAVQFGVFKKKYLYGLMGMVVSGKVRKVEKMKVDKDLTKKIADAIRADRKAFKLDAGVLTGSVKDLGDIKMVETRKTLKTGKTQLHRQLFVAGKLVLEGGQLGIIKNALVKTGAHRTMKDILADANDAVSDLI